MTDDPSVRLTAERLEMPAQRAVRLIARTRLEQLGEAHRRLKTADARALHDFRVDLRRLRTWIKAFRPYFDDSLERKSRRGLRKVARATNAVRDAELTLESLDVLNDLPPRAQRARGRLRTLLKAERVDVVTAIDESLGWDFGSLLDELGEQLSHYRVRMPVDDELQLESMRVVMVAALRRSIDKLARELRKLRSSSDVKAAHRARLATKRARYLLESLELTPQGLAVLERLEAMQRSLGVYHDAQVVVNQLVDTSVALAAKAERRRARVRLGQRSATRSSTALRPNALLDLATRIETRGGEAFAAFHAARDDRALVDAARGVVDEIVA
jgi:CHAD domain-containing protein